jgi:hypothetical protein
MAVFCKVQKGKLVSGRLKELNTRIVGLFEYNNCECESEIMESVVVAG